MKPGTRVRAKSSQFTRRGTEGFLGTVAEAPKGSTSLGSANAWTWVQWDKEEPGRLCLLRESELEEVASVDFQF